VRVLEAGDWSLLLPDEWFAEKEDGVIFIGDRDGVGCLEISELRRSDDSPASSADAAMEELLEPGVAWSRAHCGSFSGFKGAFTEDDAALREWYLSCGDLLLYITYSCDPSNAGMDDAAVDEMLETLRFAVADS
jgi:hypothetical protein